ncbi:MAG TPA: hypothetical protein VJQ45_01225 [Ktedonobacterales bacterium]|nr:hypothetical protein [Ktedonobacterales bacterium]
MRLVRARSFWSVFVATLVLGMILGGCGATTTANQVATATTAPTATPYPTATVSPSDVEVAGCPAVPLGPVPPNYTTVDGLKVSIPQRWTALDYPSALLPSNLPNAPYQIPAGAVTNFQPNPPVNPALATGYALQVCNQTSAPHTVSSLSVTIARFTPSSGPVAVWHICQDGPYNAATKQTTTGCGGGLGGVAMMAASFPSDAAGASAPVTANAKTSHGGPTPPFAIGPNQSVTFLIAVNGLTSQGTYALTLGLSLDGASPTTLTPSDGSFLIAPAATVWTGTACKSAAMQAHIPASSQDTYYVCPPAS